MSLFTLNAWFQSCRDVQEGKNYQAIKLAVAHQHTACAELLLKAGADVNATEGELIESKSLPSTNRHNNPSKTSQPLEEHY